MRVVAFTQHDHFAREEGVTPPALTPAAQELLLAHPWPGNVRELRNAMHHGVVLCSGPWLDVAGLPERLLAEVPRTSDRR